MIRREGLKWDRVGGCGEGRTVSESQRRPLPTSIWRKRAKYGSKTTKVGVQRLGRPRDLLGSILEGEEKWGAKTNSGTFKEQKRKRTSA